MPTMLLAPTLRITRLCNSHQLLLTQCLLSALRITPPASPIWSFYSLFSSYANYRYLHIRSPQTHIPLFSFPDGQTQTQYEESIPLDFRPHWFNVISKTFIWIEASNPSAEMQLMYSTAPAN